MLLTVAAIILLLAGFTEGNTVTYERITFGFSEYFLNIYSLNWDESRTNCDQIEDGFDLAVIDNEDEGNVLRGWINESRWIGVKFDSTANKFLTVDGEDLPYTDWAANHPDTSSSTNCVIMSDNSVMKWEDDVCSSVKGAVCEKKIVTTTVLPDIPVATWKHVKETGAEGGERIDLYCNIDQVNNRDRLTEVDWEVKNETGWYFYERGFSGVDEWLHLHEHNTTQLYGSMVRCVVYETKTVNRRLQTIRQITSSALYLGLQLVDRSGIKIDEGDCVDVAVKQTIPFMCHNTNPDCSIEILVEAIDLKTVTCGKDEYEQQNVHFNVSNTCNSHLMSGTAFGVANSNADIIQDQEVTITVCGTRDARFDKLHTSRIQMSTRHYRSGPEPWINKILGNFEVSVTDLDQSTIKGASCYSSNDPHMKNMDGQTYEMQMTGRYVFYRHLKESIEVQVEFAQCQHGWTNAMCNCGIAIRAWDSYFVKYGCDGKEREPVFHQCRKHLKVIQNGDDSFEITVRDTQLKIHFNKQTRSVDMPGFIGVITLNPSSRDNGNIEGLCGNFNGDKSDDFRLQNDNRIDEVLQATPDSSTHEFGASWEVDVDQDLFEMSSCPAKSKIFSASETHCSCILKQEGLSEGDGESNDEHLCERPSGIQEACARMRDSQPYLAYTTCHETLNRTTNECANARKKRDVKYIKERMKRTVTSTTAVPGSDNVTWTNGWSEEKAENFCSQSIMNASFTETCNNVTGFNTTTSTAECVADILLTGETEFVETTLAGMQTLCFNEVLKSLAATDDVSNVTSSNATTNTTSTTSAPQPVAAAFNVMPPIFVAVLCTDRCDAHGECDAGICICDPGWHGVDCEVHFSLTPILDSFNECDDSSCLQVQVNGDNFTRVIENISCEVTITQLNENKQDVATMTETVIGTYLVSTAVNCPIPEFIPSYATKIDITVSNNGFNTSSNTESFVTSPACVNCSSDPCFVMDDFCFIDGTCVEEGGNNTAEDCVSCSSTISQVAWTNTHCTTTPPATLSSTGTDSQTAAITSPATAGPNTIATNPPATSPPATAGPITATTIPPATADPNTAVTTPPATAGPNTAATTSPATAGPNTVASPDPTTTGPNSATNNPPATAGPNTVASPDPTTAGPNTVASPDPTTTGPNGATNNPPATAGPNTVASPDPTTTGPNSATNNPPATAGPNTVASPDPTTTSTRLSTSGSNGNTDVTERTGPPIAGTVTGEIAGSTTSTETGGTPRVTGTTTSTAPTVGSISGSGTPVNPDSTSISTPSNSSPTGSSTDTASAVDSSSTPTSTSEIVTGGPGSSSTSSSSASDAVSSDSTRSVSTQTTRREGETDGPFIDKPLQTVIIAASVSGVVVIVAVVSVIVLMKIFHKPTPTQPNSEDSPYYRNPTPTAPTPDFTRPSSGWSQFRAPPDFLVPPAQ